MKILKIGRLTLLTGVFGIGLVSSPGLLAQALTPDQLTIRIEEIASSVVYVIGEVKAPMAYPALGKDTILQVLTRAGGLTVFADRDSIRIIRRNGFSATTYIVDYNAIIKGDFTQDILLYPGDRVIVP